MSHERERTGYQAEVLRQAKLGQAAGRLRPGTVTVMEISHDAECPRPSGAGPCNCRPEVRMVPLDPPGNN